MTFRPFASLRGPRIAVTRLSGRGGTATSHLHDVANFGKLTDHLNRATPGLGEQPGCSPSPGVARFRWSVSCPKLATSCRCDVAVPPRPLNRVTAIRGPRREAKGLKVMFNFLHRSGRQSASSAVLSALGAEGLPPGTDVSGVGAVEAHGRFAGRKVTYVRIFDAK